MVAMKAVEEGMTEYRASQQYGVPRSTLYNRISGRVAHGINPGLKPYLSCHEEKELGKYLKHCAKVGYGKTRKDVICIVESAAHSRGLLRSNHVTDGWWQRFLQCQFDLSLRQGDSRGTKKVWYRSSSRTIVGCANAIGQAIPPMIIYDAARLNPAWTRDEVLGTIASMD